MSRLYYRTRGVKLHSGKERWIGERRNMLGLWTGLATWPFIERVDAFPTETGAWAACQRHANAILAHREEISDARVTGVLVGRTAEITAYIPAGGRRHDAHAPTAPA